MLIHLINIHIVNVALYKHFGCMVSVNYYMLFLL